MWIVDDDGDMFNTDHLDRIVFLDDVIKLCYGEKDKGRYYAFYLSTDLDEEERLTRYYDLMKKLTGERPDE